jgi:hypothetical protein
MADELKLLLLARFATTAEAEMAKELLAEEGVESLLSGTHDPLGVVSGAQPLLLYVAEEDFLRAQQVYQAFFTGEVFAEDDEV